MPKRDYNTSVMWKRYAPDPELNGMVFDAVAYLCGHCMDNHNRYAKGSGYKWRSRVWRCPKCWRLMHDYCQPEHVLFCGRVFKAPWTTTTSNT